MQGNGTNGAAHDIPTAGFETLEVQPRPGPPKPPEQVLADALAGAGFGSATWCDAQAERLRARRDGRERPIATPWAVLDDALGGGLWPGLHFLVGGTGSGKSQFAMQIAMHASEIGAERAGHTPAGVLYIALELGPLDLYARAAGILSGRKWSDYFLGREDIPPATREQLQRHAFHVAVGSPRGWKHELLESHAQAMRVLHPKPKPLLIVVDFAQLLTGDERELRERISAAAYAARAVARDHDAVVLMLSSTAREGYAVLSGMMQRNKNKTGKPGEEPEPLGSGDAARLVGLGKESGDTEYAADSVLVLAKEPWPDGQRPADGTHMHLAVAKLRAGETGWIDLRFNGSVFSEPATAGGTPARVEF